MNDMMSPTVLIADDNRSERRVIAQILKARLDLTCAEVENGQEAMDYLKGQGSAIKIVVIDLNMPIMNGHEVLRAIAVKYPQIPVIILTGSEDMEDAVAALKNGATDFLSKPIEYERLEVSARNALKISFMSREISALKRRRNDVLRFKDIMGHDQGLKPSVAISKKAAACDLPVLITGETGTGKDMFARAIHGESARASQPFITVNCGAIPEKLVESTLFGHEKGAFTGAVDKAMGKFQEADGGTIFLDEIGELPLEAQVKLLRVLQQKEVEPVGSAQSVSVDVRVISATNRDLADEVRQGLFREDLYFRLNVLHIDIPPLRARKGDIALMAPYFVDRFCLSHDVMRKTIDEASLKALSAYHWPGNVRELENVISRAMALCEDEVMSVESFSFAAANESTQDSSEESLNVLNADGSFKTLKKLESEMIAMALAHCNHNITQTARMLGIAKSTLYAKMDAANDKKLA